MPYVERITKTGKSTGEKYFTPEKMKKCDTCVHKYIRLDSTKTCNRQEAGLDCEYQERELRTCPVCGGEVYRDEMLYTKDCHGITFRLVCWNCYNRLMEKGYDGEYYDEADEQIDDDY